MLSRISLSRLLWALMLCIHLPPLYKAWQSVFLPFPSAVRWGYCAWLTLAVLFFILKLLNVRWLHFQTDRRSLFVILFAIVLMHSRAIGVDAYGMALPGDIPLLSTALFACGLKNVNAFLRSLITDKQYAGAARRTDLIGTLSCAHVVCHRGSRLPTVAPRPPPRQN